MADKYTEPEAIQRLQRNGARIRGHQISMASPGIKMLGVIDFLCNYKGYYWNPQPKR